VIEIPTLYGGDSGPDLDYVASHNGLTPEEVVQIHASGTYRIYMLGFTPGFPYLGGMDERIATPRLETPRTKISGGSVGIAGAQTGIYPIDSPGGWQIIGRTPLALYDPQREEPILLQAGESIRFVPIDQETYDRLWQETREGRV
jgi:KipI family sensor histidine kinase inhibitor